jgi:hypothetical protein
VILVFNALAWGFEHVPFDAALIASITAAFPGEPIRFYGEADHLKQTQQQLRRKLPDADVTWCDIALPPRVAPPAKRIADDFRLTRALLGDARRLGASRVIACYMHSTTGLLALKALSYLYRGYPVAFIHHGSLLRLLSSRRYHPVLRFGNGRVRQLVLGDSIRAEVLHRLPGMRDSMQSIRHPYFFDDVAPSQLPQGGPIRFSFLGLVDDTKNFPAFVSIATAVAPSWPEKVAFDLIGGTREGPLPEPPGPWVKTYSDGGPMPRDRYDTLLGQTSYALFPYDQVFYKLIASGSVLDALAAGKPFIALRTAQFEEMFRLMGDIGYLCDDVAEMQAVVTGILRDPPHERYRQQSLNILTGRKAYSPAEVGAQLRATMG